MIGVSVTQHAVFRWRERVNRDATFAQARSAIEEIVLHGKAIRQRPHKRWGLATFHVEDRERKGIYVICKQEGPQRFKALTVVDEAIKDEEEMA